MDDFIQQNASVITEYQQPSGAYPASPYFSAYHYTWFRDGSFTADAMSRAGQIESAEQFFAWGAKVVTDRRDVILGGGTLDARYSYDGQESHEAWANFQLDGFGIFLWALKEHERRHDRSIEQYEDAAGLLQHYLATHWREPSFDWWEERLGTHAASLASIYAGLKAYEHPEADAVKAAINLSDNRTDASVLACALFDAVSQDEFSLYLQKIESELQNQNGGVYRYKDDVYFGGGEWPVLAAMLGWYYVKLGRVDEAKVQLAWCKEQVGENYWIPEQTQTDLLHPEQYQPWVDQAGEPASPLLWSHAMVITLASELDKA